MNPNFEKLATAFATKNGLDPKHIVAGGAFEVSNILCSLLHDAEIDKDRFFVYADLGATPTKNPELAYLNLLKQNYDAFAVANSRFSISPANGHAIFTISLDANTTTFDHLMEEIKGAAALGQEWQKSYFTGFQIGAKI
ncbi:CesT family type III secretion system chaperone [Hydrogenophaga sp.]|uniref:CesT family type III secretion system chaperone n=1 Tax=Hydrogenophaga sp. TaxID=1904254 RepID=UPI002FC997DA